MYHQKWLILHRFVRQCKRALSNTFLFNNIDLGFGLICTSKRLNLLCMTFRMVDHVCHMVSSPVYLSLL